MAEVIAAETSRDVADVHETKGEDLLNKHLVQQKSNCIHIYVKCFNNNLPFVIKCEEVVRGFIFKFRLFYYHSSHMGMVLSEL